MAENSSPMAQARALEFIKTFIAEKGYSPTMREITEGIGAQSPQTAHKAVHALMNRGLITMVPDSPRTIRVVDDDS